MKNFISETSKIDNVNLGSNCKIYHFANLYRCKIGKEKKRFSKPTLVVSAIYAASYALDSLLLPILANLAKIIPSSYNTMIGIATKL